ncbi:MAG TPA: MmcQ/YjbR family DNA-binding protein [Segetibacter sp.]|jgi:hypothetical protein
MTAEQFTELALAFPNTIAAPHFNRTAFKVIKKRIFSTLHVATEIANLKFSPADQSVYCLIDKDAIYAINNKWGLQGWTTFELKKIPHEIIQDALNTAYRETFTKDKKYYKYSYYWRHNFSS